MWRIPVFLLGLAAAFLLITWVSASLAHAGVYWAAVTVLVAGCTGAARAAFPALTWTVEGGRGRP